MSLFVSGQELRFKPALISVPALQGRATMAFDEVRARGRVQIETKSKQDPIEIHAGLRPGSERNFLTSTGCDGPWQSRLPGSCG